MSDPVQANFKRLFGPEFGHGKAFALGRLRAGLGALGDPQEKLPPVIHVAGTNGKGSTIAFMRAIAEAAGLRIHAFTKPHLHELRERFLVSGQSAANAALIAAAERVARADASLTQFDAQVAAAFVLFSEAKADLALLEAGMGGRDDSTNIVAAALSVITPIGLDHQDVLGAALSDIAAHKAGIIKRSTPAVVARQQAEAMDVIEAEAMRLNAPLWRHGVEWDAFESQGRLIVQTEARALDLPLPSLAGRHQIENAGLACAALLSWRAELADEAFAQGVANAAWPARLQPLTRGPLSAPIRAIGGEVWVDGGHNAHAAAALARALDEMARKRSAPTAVIVGMRARKDWRAFVEAIAPHAALFIAAPLGDDGAGPEAMAAHAASLGVASECASQLSDALARALAHGAKRVLICGSLLLAAEALADA